MVLLLLPYKSAIQLYDRPGGERFMSCSLLFWVNEIKMKQGDPQVPGVPGILPNPGKI